MDCLGGLSSPIPRLCKTKKCPDRIGLKTLHFLFSPISHGANKNIPVEVQSADDINPLKGSGFSKACGWVYKLWWRYICYACPIGTHVKPGGKECIDCSAGQFHW